MLRYQMAVLMLGDQVAVLMMKTKNPVQQKPWCRTSVAGAVVQNKCSRSRGAVKSSRSMDRRILSLLRGSVENM